MIATLRRSGLATSALPAVMKAFLLTETSSQYTGRPRGCRATCLGSGQRGAILVAGLFDTREDFFRALAELLVVGDLFGKLPRFVLRDRL